MFVDIVSIEVRSGKGGNGAVSFRREKFVPKGGPDGGDGGKGGDVVFMANPHLTTLLDFRYNRHYRAENGQAGGKSNKTGRGGKNIVIKVPLGTLIKNEETGEIVADLTEAGQREVVARGGWGGRGNAAFKSPTNQSPRNAEEGRNWQELALTLELKLIADAGLVGFPNAGKSTLISTISAAKPKIADYPFTTLVPNIGMVRLDMEKNFALADIPGLIEGAHRGKGLGHQFLRHVERNRLLVFLLDLESEREPWDQYNTLIDELRNFSPELVNKPQIICLSKIDAIPPEFIQHAIDTAPESVDRSQILTISSVTQSGLEKLKWRMWDIIEALRAEENPEEEAEGDATEYIPPEYRDGDDGTAPPEDD